MKYLWILQYSALKNYTVIIADTADAFQMKVGLLSNR